MPDHGRPGDRHDLSGVYVDVDAAQGLGQPERQPQPARPQQRRRPSPGGERRRAHHLSLAHLATAARSSERRDAVRSIQRRSASMWNRAWSHASTVSRGAPCFSLVSSRI